MIGFVGVACEAGGRGGWERAGEEADNSPARNDGPGKGAGSVDIMRVWKIGVPKDTWAPKSGMQQ